MSIDELIEILQDAAEELGGESEVRLAIQPSWPFEHRIANDVAITDGVVYLAEAGQIGYLPVAVSEDLGWK